MMQGTQRCSRVKATFNKLNYSRLSVLTTKHMILINCIIYLGQPVLGQPVLCVPKMLHIHKPHVALISYFLYKVDKQNKQSNVLENGETIDTVRHCRVCLDFDLTPVSCFANCRPNLDVSN